MHTPLQTCTHRNTVAFTATDTRIHCNTRLLTATKNAHTTTLIRSHRNNYIHNPTDTCTLRNRRTHTHTHTQAHAHTSTHITAHCNTHTRIHSYAHTATRIAHTNASQPTRTHCLHIASVPTRTPRTQACANAQVHITIHIHKGTRPCTRTRTYIRTHTRALARRHTHTHARQHFSYHGST